MKRKLVLKITILAIFILFASVGVIENYIPVASINCANAQCATPGDGDGDGHDCDTAAGENSVNCPTECAWAPPPKPGDVPDSFDDTVLNATDWILGFVGMIAVLMIIWGGINYLTSAGDEEKAKTGKKTLSYALIGLVVAGIAYALVKVVVSTILV